MISLDDDDGDDDGDDDDDDDKKGDGVKAAMEKNSANRAFGDRKDDDASVRVVLPEEANAENFFNADISERASVGEATCSDKPPRKKSRPSNIFDNVDVFQPAPTRDESSSADVARTFLNSYSRVDAVAESSSGKYISGTLPNGTNR